MGFKARIASDNSGPRAFTEETFGFLIELAMHNDRDWFQANKDFYERAVKHPLQDFIESFAPHLARISGEFRADAKSMFRIYRDVRFSKDKRPYKTHASAHFRHQAGKDAHAPGFYLHIEPGGVFAGGGVWRPAAEPLLKIRKAIAKDPDRWQAIVDDPAFRKRASLRGDSLARPPRGFDKEHPAIEELKRKDFIAMMELDDGDVLAGDFVERFSEACRVVAPFNRFLCDAIGVPF